VRIACQATGKVVNCLPGCSVNRDSELLLDPAFHHAVFIEFRVLGLTKLRTLPMSKPRWST
jgi:hypothetical protein